MSQFQRITCGIRYKIGSKEGFVLVVSRGPDSALNIPNAVSGKTMDLRSFLAINQIV